MIRHSQIFASLFPHLQSDVNPNKWVVPQGGNTTDFAGGSGRPDMMDTRWADESEQDWMSSPNFADEDNGGDTRQVTSTPIKTSQQLNDPSWEDRHPDFQFPHSADDAPLTSQQSAENALAQARYKRAHPENEDHGVKGVLKELLGNFLTGLSQAKPGMGWKESLALGGVGAGAGALNRTWNEQRQLNQLIPTLEKDAKQETQNSLRNEQISTIRRDDARGQSELLRKQDKDARDYSIKQLTLNFKKEDRDRYYELEDIKQAAKVKQDQKTYDLAVQKQKELERHNGVTEQDADLNREGREKVANILAGSHEKIAGMQIADKEKERVFRTQFQQDAQEHGLEIAKNNAREGFKKAYLKAHGKQPTKQEIDDWINEHTVFEANASGDVEP